MFRAFRAFRAFRERLSRRTGGGAPPAPETGAALDDLCAALEAWDYRYTPESTAPLLFETFMRHWQRRVAAERFPARLLPLVQAQGSAAARLIEGDDPGWFPDAGALHTALRETAGEAMAEVRRSRGDDPAGWRWDAVHLAHWRHVLSRGTTADAFDFGPRPVDGSSETVRNTGLSATFGADSGAEYRLVVDFSQPESFLAVQNTGNSGQPGSPHYGDQFAPWMAGTYHVVHLRRGAVEGEMEGRTVLEPAPG